MRRRVRAAAAIEKQIGSPRSDERLAAVAGRRLQYLKSGSFGPRAECQL
jgi:hypothetical protein